MGSTPTLSLSIPAGDYVNHMLLMVFGPIWTAIANSGLNTDSIGSSSGGVFGPAFLIYNLAILTMTIFYIVKVIFEGVAGTANHGEWLGKQFSGYWTTLRIVAMLGLIAPVASGYSLSQIVVLWTGAQAIGAADSIANTMMSTVISQGVVFNPQIAPSARAVAEGILQDDVCLLTYDNPMNSSSTIMQEKTFSSSSAASGSSGASSISGIEFGGVPGSNIAPDACGSVTVAGANAQTQQAMIAGLNAMMPVLTPVAEQIVKNAGGAPNTSSGTGAVTTGSSSGILPNQISVAANDYAAAIQSSVAAEVNSANGNMTTSWSNALQQDGFATLGTFMIQITQWDKLISSNLSAQPLVSGPDYSALQTGWGLQSSEAAVTNYEQNDNPLSASGGPTAMDNQGIKIGMSKSGHGMIENLIVPFITRLNGGILSEFSSFSSSVTNPIGQIQSVGVSIITFDIVGVVATIGLFGTAGAATSNFFSSAAGGHGAFTAAFGLIKPILLLLFAVPFFVGADLAYVIPSILYIVFTVSVLSWVSAIIIGTLGAPLWAGAHAVPDGEGFVPSAAAQGYKLLLSMFAKPSLIVFGFFAGISMFSAGVFLINSTFIFAFNSVLGGTLNSGGILSIVAALSVFTGTMVFITIYCVMIHKLALWSFSLTHIIPDHALSWIGLNDMNLREHELMTNNAMAGIYNKTGGGSVTNVPKDMIQSASAGGRTSNNLTTTSSVEADDRPV